MQELTSVSNASLTNLTLATVGGSSDSTQSNQSHNHGSQQKHQKFQSNKTQAPHMDLNLHEAVNFDPVSQSTFAAAYNQEESKNDGPFRKSASLVELNLTTLQTQQISSQQQHGGLVPKGFQNSHQFAKVHTLVSNEQSRSITEKKSLAKPQNMVFERALSSPGLKISSTGLTIESTDKGQKAVTNHCFSEGVAYFEVLCPVRCSSICQNPISVTQNFHSSTKRTVGVEINIKEGEIRYFINGRYSKKLKSKELKNPGYLWHGYIEFKEAGNNVILNPYCKYPVPISKSIQLRSKLPETLFFDVAHIQVTLLEQHIGNHLLVCQQPQKTHAEHEKTFMDLASTQKVKVEVMSPEITEATPTNVALLKFSTHQEMIQFTKAASQSKLTVLDPRNIAKLLHYSKVNHPAYIPAFDQATPAISKHIQDKYGQWLEQQFNLNADQLKQTLFGFAPDQIQPILPQIDFESVKAFQVNHTLSDVIVRCSDRGQVIVASGSELKLFKTTNQHDFSDFTNFSNFPVKQLDPIFLSITPKDLQFLIKNLVMSQQSVVQVFWDHFSFSYNGSKAMLPYTLALQAVQILGANAQQQYKRFELFGNEIAMNDSNKTQSVADYSNSDVKVTITEIHKLMSIVVDLEDQLWSMIQDERVSNEVRQLWPPVIGRVHTAYGRISSFFNLNDSDDPQRLADLGLYNQNEGSKLLSMHQEPNVPIESIHQGQNNIVETLEKQFVANLLLKGLPTWNVPLQSTLNHLPSRTHSNQKQSYKVDQILTAGNFALSCNNQSGVVNLWSTQLGLQKIMTYNFRKQANVQEDQVQNCTLKHTKFAQVYEKDGVVVLLKGGQQQVVQKPQPLFTEQDLKEQIPAEEDQDGYFFGLFAETEDALTQDKLETKSDLSVYSIEDEDQADFFLQEMSFTEAWLSPVALTSPTVDLAKETPKEQQKEEKKSFDEKQVKIILDLTLMGFPKKLIEQALLKVKKTDFQDVLDEVLTLQAALPQPKPEPVPESSEIVTWKAYSCLACTFNNFENPTKLCQVCGFEAPEEAKIVTKIEKAIDPEVLKQKEKERLLKQEQEEKAQAELEKKRQKELVQKIARQKQYAETREYFINMQVKQYFMALNADGKSKKPVLIAAVMQGDKKLDIHFKWARYTKDYMDNFKNFDQQVIQRQFVVEALYPSIQHSQEQILRMSDIGLARFNLHEVTCVSQLAHKFDEKSPLSILVSGKNEEGEHRSFIIQVRHNNRIEVTQINQHFIRAFEADQNKILAQGSESLQLFEIKNGAVEQCISIIETQPGETLTGVSNQTASLKSGDRIRTFSLSRDDERSQAISRQNNSNSVSELEVLQLQIDPDKITVEDLDKYESLLKGSLSLGKSNASKKQGETNGNFIKHIWYLDEFSGPMEIQLAKPCNLLSLNIEVSFKCTDLSQLVYRDQKQSQNAVKIGDDQNTQTFKQQQLGQFSMRAFSDEPIPKTNQAQTYLPLVVWRNEGSCYNNNLIPSKMLVDNDQLMFASNYGKPEIVFAHMNQERMIVDKITIKNAIGSKTGAYPMGEGMIFLSDSLQPFEQTDTFRNFTAKDYQQWKEERSLDERPLRCNEPVAYFQFDDSVQITFELDCKRAARFIMLKPTGFRQKPNPFCQNADQVPMEIQFFGVSGKSLGDEDFLESIQVNDTTQNLGISSLGSDYDCEVKILGTDNQIAFVKNFQIDQLRLYEQPIGLKTMLNNIKQIDSHSHLEGLSLLRITDSNLQLKLISGVSITITQSGKSVWQLQNAQITGVEAKVSGDDHDESLFQCPQLPSQFYRSCLLSPNFFNVVNKQITSIVSDSKFNHRLRVRAMYFLKKLMSIDPKLSNLVLQQVDLKNFLQSNVFGSQQQLVQQSENFLQSFQQDLGFSQNLYDILIESIKQLPDKVIGWNGYEALIGMIKWAVPQDLEKTLDVLLNTTYVKLIQDKIQKLQKEEVVVFRTKIAPKDKSLELTPYPFDQYFFRSIKRQSADSQTQSALTKRQDLIRQCEIVTPVAKKGSLVTEITVNFCELTTVNMLKLFFEKSEYLYQFQIEVFDGPTTVYFMHHSAQTFYLFSNLAHGPSADPNADYALTITNLNHTCKLVNIKITYSATANTAEMIKTNAAIVPKVFVETYGKIDDKLIASAEAKHAKLVAAAGNKKTQFGHSIAFVNNQTNKQTMFVPEIVNSINEVAKPVQSTHEEHKGNNQTLRLLQDELIGGIAAEKSDFKELLANIKQNQFELQQDSSSSDCLEYLITVASDLTKLIHYISNMKTVDMRSHFLKFTNDLPSVCLTFFKHLVAYESGQKRKDMIKFIKQCMFGIMNQQEIKQFIYKIFDEFLSEARSNISQRKVIGAIHKLGVSHNDLTDYLDSILCIGSTNLQKSPITTMYCVLNLCLRQFTELKTLPQKPESDGQGSSNFDHQYKIIFSTSVWVCENQGDLFTREEQIAILNLTTQSLSELGKVVNLQPLRQISEDKQAIENLMISVLCFDNYNLLVNLESILKHLWIRFNSSVELLKDQISMKATIRADAVQLKQVQFNLSLHQQNILFWLVDQLLNQQQITQSSQGRDKLLQFCKGNRSTIMNQINQALEIYLDQKSRLQLIDKFIAEGDAVGPSDLNLVGLIRSFIKVLCQQQQSNDAHHTQQLWTLVLKTISTVSVNTLLEQNLLDEMIQAFLQSNIQIQQITYSQILKISESIARTTKNGKFLCNLLFQTFQTQMENLSKSSQTVLQICQGWLDILILGHCSTNTKSENGNGPVQADQINARLDADDVSRLMLHAANYLSVYLNLGNFDGCTGCHTDIVMKLELADNILGVILKSQLPNSESNKSVQDLFKKCQHDPIQRENMRVVLDRLVTWLFLSGRLDTDGSELITLSVAQQTPATGLQKNITNQIIRILETLSDCVTNSEVIQLGLSSLTQVVRSMNKAITSKAKNQKLSFDASLKLTKRTNYLFTKLLANWLVSDQVVNFFVFELRGFEFLLDTIAPAEEQVTQTSQKRRQSALKGSDLEQMLFGNDKTSGQPTTKLEQEPPKENFSVSLLEFGKNMKLKDTNGPEAISAYQAIDWSVNKKVHKHKVYFKALKDNKGFVEHEMLFQLPNLSLIREIQIGFQNFSQSEQELIVEPSSIVVHAGVDQENFNLICTLDQLQDSAFGSVSAVVFGKNMLEFQQIQDTKLYNSIEQAVNAKIECLTNFKANFIKFSMRKNVVCCLENSSLANRLTKPLQFGLNFISVTGYDLNQVKGDYANFVQGEQKKTAMEVMSLICSGNYSSALSVIANQPETIEKIKTQFDYLANVVELKSVMIEPTFVSISTHNSEMGDWIIRRFINTRGFEKHANLCGKIVVCDKVRIGSRLQMVQDCILETLHSLTSNKVTQASHIKSLVPFIEMYIRTAHLVAPGLNEEEIVFNVTHEQLLELSTVLNNSTQERQTQSQKLMHFIVLLMCPPKPFKNQAINLSEFAQQLLNQQGPLEQVVNQRLLASLIAVNFSEVAWEIYKGHKESLSLLFNLSDATLGWAKFWLNIANDRKVRSRLQDEQIPVKIYQSLKEQKPLEANRVIKIMSEECLVTLVELILRISAGNAQLEQKLAQLVIDDMKQLSNLRDMLYINKVIQPLIKNEYCVPVCLNEHQSKQNWVPNVDCIQDQSQQPQPKYEKNNTFVPSTLFEAEVRNVFINVFKEIVGKVNTQSMEKSLASQWTLMHKVEQAQAPGHQFKPMWQSIEGRGPMVMLIKGVSKHGQKVLFGGYCSQKMPACPQSLDQDVDIHIKRSVEDFLFANVEGKGWFFFKPLDQQAILEFFADYESGGAISMGNDFMLISHSYDFEFKVGMIDCLQEINIDAVQSLKDKNIFYDCSSTQQFKLERAEIWISGPQPNTKVSSTGKNLTFKQKIISQISLQSGASHPWVHQLSSYNLFRGKVVYMVPAHVQIKQLAEILLFAKDQTNLTNIQLTIQQSDTLQQVYDKFMDDEKNSEAHQNILDLCFNLENLGNNHFDEDEDQQRVSKLYAPKCGFFDFFDKEGGAKSFILLAQSQLNFWKNQQAADNWRIWLKQIDSFCDIPLFFQFFLKNQNGKDILYKIVNNDPLKEEQKQELQQKEQKEAVENNYKILAEIFAIPSSPEHRNAAVRAGFLPIILERLSAVSGEKPRVVEEEDDLQQNDQIDAVPKLTREPSAKDEGVRKARKGVGYSAKQGETWNVDAYFDNKKVRNEQIKTLLDICYNFFNTSDWSADQEVLQVVLQSALLPLIENAFRNGSWIDMVKEAPLYHSYLALTRSIACQHNLIGCLVEIDKKYKPIQNQPIYVLLEKLNDLATIFLNCLNQQNQNIDSPKIFLNVNANPFNLPTVNEPFKWTQNPLPKLTYSMEEDLDQLLMASYMNKPADKDDSLEEFKPLHKQKSLANIPVQMMMSESESSDSNEAITLAVTKMANSLKEIEQIKQNMEEAIEEKDDDWESVEEKSYDGELSSEQSEQSQKNAQNFGMIDAKPQIKKTFVVKSSSSSQNNSYYDSSDSSSSSFEHSHLSPAKPISVPLPKSPQHANLQYSVSEVPEKLAKDVAKTYQIVTQTIENFNLDKTGLNEIVDALNLPVPQQYRSLLQKLRFEYMDMKSDGVKYNHHYNSLLPSNESPPQAKTIRLAQELTDLSYALPSEHTNAIFVRVDKSRVDLMKALITGATGTPYAHGCYEFDLFCENGYPSGPPKMNLETTGVNQIRFNPNLYACGKVCLSLLNTWRGQATENWDAKLSTILQVLVSVQAIIMSEEVYFNEPGFEQEAGTPEGEKKNEGYMNIVRYGNVKYAMLGQIKNPSKGFETVIKRHFYIKRAEILTDIKQWVTRADKVEANFTGLVSDHNPKLAKEFQKSKTKYREMLAAAVDELEEELNKLERPNNYQIKPKVDEKRKKIEVKKIKIDEGQQNLEDVDMDTDEETQVIDTNKQDIDVDDEAVKDRWSRYIGAMGVEAVAKQAAANIFLSGAGALGVEIAKNLVLSGCKSFTLHDTNEISQTDFSGQFFLSESDKVKYRVEACLPRLQQLNFYVKCKMAPIVEIPTEEEDLEKQPWSFQDYHTVILTDCTYTTAKVVSEYCHKRGKKFICADVKGVFGRVFNDFGDAFEVLDKNGEELQDCLIKSISNEEHALVELLPNAKHKFEDGDEVCFTNIQGMELLEGATHVGEQNVGCKSQNINETIHKVIVVNPYAFKIGDTRHYGKYLGNGVAKQLRTKMIMKFQPFNEALQSKDVPMDGNMSIADFEKMANNTLAHVGFEALDNFKTVEKRMPKPWDLIDANKFLVHAKAISSKFGMDHTQWKPDGVELKILYLFCFQCTGTFNPMCAFFGGYVAQEAVKAITGKFTPTNQLFYYDASEVLPAFDPSKDLATFEDFVSKIGVTNKQDRNAGLRICVGQEVVDKLNYTRLFMVGAGAIGCELLKNYAMLGVGTGQEVKGEKLAGQIVLTDPDVIEVSNLNRQFLFREKHLRKPKSQTAAAAAIYMNPELKGHIIARLDKVFEGSAHIFTDKFFEDLTIVTNALDNVQARKYIDARCVTAKTPLLESGTLGPKGHVQVILPYKTESYGQQEDPEDNNEIPICTMKMFPEETLHCVEWARDQFGNIFTQKVQSTIKLLEEGANFQPNSTQDVQLLKQGIKMLEKKPKNFMDCLENARKKFEKSFNHDIKQLLHVYPLDAKTKEGNLFWSLPKRPPVPIDFDPNEILHCTLIASMACLRARLFFIEIPNTSPRSDEFRRECGALANQFKMKSFVPNDEKAKEIQASVSKAGKSKEEQEEVKEETKPEVDETLQLMLKLQKLLGEIKLDPKKQVDQYLIRPEVFEKDNDQNFHIDFMYSMANCRSLNYKLEPMDWINVKLKAGRIVPALATTTASIAGLQALELVKVLKELKTDQFRNVFLNLAVPSMTASEPGPVQKVKLLEGLEVSLWDRWEIKDFKQQTLQKVIDHIETTFKGLEVRDIMKGNTPIYFHVIMSAQGKEAEKKALLESSVKKVTECEGDELYVDLNITCVRKDDLEQKILAGVPPVRIIF